MKNKIQDFFQKYSFSLFLILFSLAYVIYGFKGIDFHSGYHGNTYKAIYPDSFPKDRYFPSTRPTSFSLFYVLIHILGKICLDDRFFILVYFVWVFAAVIALDKIIQTLHIKSKIERAALLSIFFVQHRFRDNTPQIVSTYNFNPTAMSYPVILWLTYYFLKGQNHIKLLFTALLAIAISVKNAWLPAFIALGSIYFEALTLKMKRISLSLALLTLGGGLFVYYQFIRESTDPALFNLLLATTENSEAHPFLESFFVNFLYILICFLPLLFTFPSKELTKRVRFFSIIAMAVFLIGGLYYSFAPDFLKIPFLISLAVNRATWWPQFIFMLILCVKAFQIIKENRRSVDLYLGLSILFCIALIIPSRPYTHLLILFSVLSLASLYLILRFQNKIFSSWITYLRDRIKFVRILCGSILFVILVGFINIFVKNIDPLKFLFKQGVCWYNQNAKWVPLNEFIVSHIPSDAIILALSYQNRSNKSEGIYFDTSVKIRTGRSMSIGHPIAHYFNYPEHLKSVKIRESLKRMERLWLEHDFENINNELNFIGWPDYFAIDVDLAPWISERSDFNYHPVFEAGHYIIFKKI